MNYEEAKPLAEKLARRINPGCVRIEIVGSVKRGDKLDVHDIELLVIPDPKAPRPEFGQKVLHKTRLDKVLFDLCQEGVLRFIEGGDKLKKYQILGMPVDFSNNEPFKLELYIVRPETWGIQNVIRTGPREFSHRFVTNVAWGGLLPDDHRYIKGETRIECNGKTLELPEEADALAVIGLGWIEPKERRKYS